MNIFYANLIFILTRYFTFLRSFFKNSFIKSLILSISYFLYAYACFYIGAYSGVIIFALYGLITYNLVYKVYRNIFGKILFTTVIGLIIYFYEGCNFLSISFIPYYIFLIDMWFIKYLLIKHKNINKYVTYIKDILWMIYAYNIKLYVLFIYKVASMTMNVFGKLLPDIVKKINKKTV